MSCSDRERSLDSFFHFNDRWKLAVSSNHMVKDVSCPWFLTLSNFLSTDRTLQAVGIRTKAALASNEYKDAAQEVFDEMTERLYPSFCPVAGHWNQCYSEAMLAVWKVAVSSSRPRAVIATKSSASSGLC
ncbi:hypothetical protein BT93_G0130 [Corymbia citriodora subsp. variegata]|nr:hypothetical protein BT93_G0130 [Corymbia citriodora subsp. variegata]KAF8019363.1 hypothetical protein BT93_G0130 [Corymbia citriodora subsp. variegata]